VMDSPTDFDASRPGPPLAFRKKSDMPHGANTWLSGMNCK